MAKGTYTSRLAEGVQEFSEKRKTGMKEIVQPKEEEKSSAAVKEPEQEKPVKEKKAAPAKAKAGDSSYSTKGGLTLTQEEKVRRSCRVGYLITPAAKENIEKFAKDHNRNQNDMVNYLFEHIFELIPEK